MDAMINGRTPEEIKKGLKMHAQGERCVEDGAYCPYYALCKKRFPPVMRDALTLIEHLESERDAAMVKVPGWISVEEKMPPEDTEVLVYATEKIKGFGSVTAICEYSETTSMFGNKTGRYDWSSPWEYFHVDYKITHWMPLPEPPKEVNDEYQADPV